MAYSSRRVLVASRHVVVQDTVCGRSFLRSSTDEMETKPLLRINFSPSPCSWQDEYISESERLLSTSGLSEHFLITVAYFSLFPFLAPSCRMQDILFARPRPACLPACRPTSQPTDPAAQQPTRWAGQKQKPAQPRATTFAITYSASCR